MIWLSMVTRLNVKEMTEIKKKKINYTIAAIVEFIFIVSFTNCYILRAYPTFVRANW